MPKSINKTLLMVCLLPILSACNHGISVGETVESAYIMNPPLPEPPYQFTRNGYSSVRTEECRFLSEPLDYLYKELLKEARLGNTYNYQQAYQLYNNGRFGLKPKEEVACSALHGSRREKIRQELEALLETSARIGGHGQPDISLYRNREAKKGEAGYVGNNLGDKNIYFVDEKGLSVAEVFKYAIMGGIYLDKILNVFLDNRYWDDEQLHADHEQVMLIPGKNYTTLEHYWDLAYGYYAYWQPLTQAEGIPVLKDTETKLFRAFVQGRTELGFFQYNKVKQQAASIREELSKAIVVRTMHLLVGENTLANLKEVPQYAFLSLSQAYGLIYALQFATSPEGVPYFSTAEITEMLDSLMQNAGFWEQTRLMGEADVKGSLKQVASKLGAVFNLSLNDIKK